MLAIYARLSPLALAILISVSSLAFSIVSLWGFHRLFPKLRFDSSSNDLAQIYGGAVGTIFALIYAFVIVAAWQNYNQASSNVEQEANVLHNLYRNLDGYPPEFRDAIRSRLREYVKEVVEVEWPLPHKEITDLNTELTRYKAAGVGDLPVHEQTLQMLIQNRSLRHERIQSGESYLDPAMWISLVLGSVIVLVFSSMLRLNGEREHQLMHATLTLSIGLVFYLLLYYNWPFLGPGAITPDSLAELPERFWVLN
jgi:ABC-type multidrug transport system fused ATPase/permease subunit